MSRFPDLADPLHLLSAERALEVLSLFLSMEAEYFRTIQIGDINLNYSEDSVREVMLYLTRNQLVDHLRNEEMLSIWYARMAYYFGESLRRCGTGLSWGTGDANFAFHNHPVVRGFRTGEEAPVVTICRNVLSAVVFDGRPVGRIEDAVSHWFGAARMEV